MESKKTIATFKTNIGTFYFDIMTDYSFRIFLYEKEIYRDHSFKKCWNEFNLMAKERNVEIELI